MVINGYHVLKFSQVCTGARVSSTGQPDQTTPNKPSVWRWLSLFLIIGGLVLMGVGGWLYYQQYLVAIQPPPARIVQLTIEELEATFTAEAMAVAATPTAATTSTPAGDEPPPASTRRPALSEQSDTLNPTAMANPGEATPPPGTSTGDTAGTPVPDDENRQSMDEHRLRVLDELFQADYDKHGDLIVPAGHPDAEDGDDKGISSTVVTPEAGRMLTRIVADTIEMNADVVPVGWETVEVDGNPVSMWEVADNAAGWHHNSGLPGESGNIVLSAHHNTKGEVFRYIVDLQPGDTISLYNESGEAFDYIVDDKFIVKDKGEPQEIQRANARWVGTFDDERLTLVTCWPYTNNTHRVIVIARPPSPEAQSDIQEMQVTE
jgi:LPXTG-site transpeptidase (sortase) family protein